MNTKISRWEELFDEKFARGGGGIYDKSSISMATDVYDKRNEDIKSFINSLESSIREEAYKEGYEQGRKDARASFISGGGASGYAGHGSCGAGGSDGNHPQ